MSSPIVFHPKTVHPKPTTKIHHCPANLPIITRQTITKTAVSTKAVRWRHPHQMALQKIGFVSLGCPKALVDSERIITELTYEGYQVANDYDGADLVVVNTCGFIESAVQESLDAIGEAINKKMAK